MKEFDVIVIGAGPGGLAAGKAAAEEGARTLILEREQQAGGILNQCVHDGFGLVRYTAQLSGPEYAEIVIGEAIDAGTEIKTDTIVTEITSEGGRHLVSTLSRDGLEEYSAGAIVLATGCRERTRGMISIPGSRPAGIYTAGVAQNLMNMKNAMVGKKIVIYGTGDIGLIMARRLTLEGAEVICAIEIMNDASGLSRNVRQCLEDYNIPVYLSHCITNIYGKKRLEAIEMTALDQKGNIIEESAKRIPCDTLILSVGLIPENEVAETAGVELDAKSNGAVTDDWLQTNIEGIFSCGNCRSVMDLADFVSQQGEAAGRNAARYVKGGKLESWLISPHNMARKGLPEKGSVTCTLCPKGCDIKVRSKDDSDLQEPYIIENNGCRKGEAFAKTEMTAPERIFTSTVKLKGSRRQLLPVRSDKPIKLSEVFEVAEAIKTVTAETPVCKGQVLLEDVGVNRIKIVAECTIK